MKSFKDFLEELLHADSLAEVLRENRKETIKLAGIVVLILAVLLLCLYQQDADLEISDASSGAAQTARQDDGGADYDAAGDGAESAGAAVGMDTDGIIYVDIGGAVEHPMLAQLPVGSRVEDAIDAAGGLKHDADMTSVNRAAVLTDGEKIYIPAEGEESASDAGTGGSGAAGSAASGGQSMAGISSGRININTADTTLLQQLTGVGPVTAQKIVDYREQNGKFRSIEDLKNVSGIGDKTFEKMKDDITI